MTPQSNPPLTEGPWYVVPVNFNDTVISFTLTATVEAPPGGGGDGGGGGATGLNGDGTAKLSLVSNDNFLVPWGRLRLAYDTKVFQKDARGDLYLALCMEDGRLFIPGQEFRALSTNTIPFSENASSQTERRVFLTSNCPKAFPDSPSCFSGSWPSPASRPWTWQTGSATSPM